MDDVRRKMYGGSRLVDDVRCKAGLKRIRGKWTKGILKALEEVEEDRGDSSVSGARWNMMKLSGMKARRIVDGEGGRRQRLWYGVVSDVCYKQLVPGKGLCVTLCPKCGEEDSFAHAFGDCFRPVGKRSWAMADGEDLKEWVRQYDVELRRVLRGEESLLAEEVPEERVL